MLVQEHFFCEKSHILNYYQTHRSPFQNAKKWAFPFFYNAIRLTFS